MNSRILVTRPEAQSGPFIAALKAQGDIPLELPLMQITAYNEEQHDQQCRLITQTIQKLDQYQHVICISTNAVDSAWFWVDRYWPQLPARQIWYAIGEVTAATLKQYVSDVEQSGKAMNSESLLQHPGLQSLNNQKVLIFRGKGGREYLKEQLELRGAQVDYCEVYERQAVSYNNGEFRTYLQSGIDFLAVTSAETIQLLLDQAMIDGITREVKKLPLIAPGKRVANFAREAGFQQVIEAENAGLKAMLEAINNN